MVAGVLRSIVAAVMVMTIGETMASAQEAPGRLFVGTYTGEADDASRGIYVVGFDAQAGRFGTPRLAAETTNPSFLTLAADHSRLYSVTETRSGSGRSGAAIVAWRVADDGTLEEIGRDAAGGDGPCFVAVSPDGRLAAVANYGGGSVALFALDEAGQPQQADVVQHSGSSANPQRQGEPHAHAIQFTADGRRALAADLGTDELVVYDVVDQQLVRNDALTHKMTPGHGPRHFALSPDERYVLVIQELANVITSLRIDDDALVPVGEYPTLPEDFSGSNSTAEILIHPSGRFVYGSNRGHNSIAVFAFDDAQGTLEPLAHVSSGGATPRNFRISPDGRWMIVANQDSNNLVLFSIGEDGIPMPTGQQVVVSKPVCVKFAP